MIQFAAISQLPSLGKKNQQNDFGLCIQTNTGSHFKQFFQNETKTFMSQKKQNKTVILKI